jgi:hypothetical protein
MDRKKPIYAISGWALDLKQRTDLEFLSGMAPADFELVTDLGRNPA